MTGYLSRGAATLQTDIRSDSNALTEFDARISAERKTREAAMAAGWTFSSWDTTNIQRALTVELKGGQKILGTQPGDDAEEAALYAFSSKYYDNPSSIVQRSIWDYLSRNPGRNYGKTCNSEGKTVINDAAIYYANTWLPDKVNIKYDDTKAKARVKGTDYIVGPFTISYKEATFDKIVFSWKTKRSITDENGSQIGGVQITNSEGVSIGDDIPNGKEFYVKFPYNETMKELHIYQSIKSIDYVEATKYDVITKAYDFQFVMNTTVHADGTYFKHDYYCSYDPSGTDKNASSCNYCTGENKTKYSAHTLGWVKRVGASPVEYQNMVAFDGEVYYREDEIHLKTPLAPDTPPNPIVEMDIAGYVWEDGEQGKDQVIDGKLGDNDKRLEGIEVRLYNATLGTLAEVHGDSNGVGKTNPAITDASGHYEFKGVNPIYKYYVIFVYDGMLYTNTYGAGIPDYNTQAWSISSKGSEIVNDREALNRKFVTISSYPASYKTSAIFGGDYLTNGYNKIFEVDSSLVAYYKNRVTEQLRSYLSSNGRLEDGDSYINSIYLPIISSSSNQTEAKQVLQYIWDCRIRSYAGDESEQDGKLILAGGKYYPYYDKFALIDHDGNRLRANAPYYDDKGYWYIYDGQLYINLGLVRRPTTDLQLDEDLYRTVVSLNGQDETYEYGTFSSKGVKVNSADARLTQDVATADYYYKETASSLSSGLDGTAAYPQNYAPIEIYATYRINITNNSARPTGINEIAAYIDPNYFSYSDSYTTTGGMNIKGVYGTFLYPDSDTSYAERNLTDYDSSSFGLKVSTNSLYGTASETGKFMGNDLYISFNKNVILEQNQMVAIYITYRVGENSTKDAKFNCTYKSNRPNGSNHAYEILQDLLNKDSNNKILIYTKAEINAYSTFFKKASDVGDTQSKYSSYYNYTSDLQRGNVYRAAGILDALSIPGNLDQAQINEFEKNKKKTEDDWDSASTFVLTDAGLRNMTGNVWETVDQPANYWIEAGHMNEYPKFDSRYAAQDITVELVEIKNGTEYVRARTTTDGSGAYEFKHYIPGLYTVRFLYGDSAQYDTQQYSKYTTFTLNEEVHKAAYNGENYQSARANPNTNNNQYWYAVEESERYSDAYDEVTIRKAINDSLQTYTYKDVVNSLKHPTDYMVYAYTSLIDVEVEKAKTTTAINKQKPSYSISNVDFALTPRTESKLFIDKEVTHLKLILQNGTVQFDADTKTIREQGVPSVVQAAQGNDINISMSSELVNGATLEITYTITITNVGAEDTVTYYKDPSGNLIALGLYKEDPTKIVYYEEGAIRTHNNSGGFSRNDDDEKWISRIITGKTEMKTLDTSKTQMIETTTRADVVADFISNNLTFTKANYVGSPINSTWDLYTGEKSDFEKEYYKQFPTDERFQPRNILEMGAEGQEAEEVYDNNVIVLANKTNPLITTDLKHGESVSDTIVLSKVISVNDNSTDTKSYTNHIRILSVNNTVSRVQDMAAASEDITERSLTHTTEHVVISDPTGIGNKYLGILLTLAVAAIIGTGIVFIKKFAINNK